MLGSLPSCTCLICNKRILKIVQPNFFCYFSLKKGRIFSITHHLPEECPFASYEDLRKHWKLMVGVPLRFLELPFYVEKWWQVASVSFIFILLLLIFFLRSMDTDYQLRKMFFTTYISIISVGGYLRIL